MPLINEATPAGNALWSHLRGDAIAQHLSGYVKLASRAGISTRSASNQPRRQKK